MSDLENIEKLVAEYYSVEARVYPLPSYDDLNYKLETNSGKYVLKLSQVELDGLEFENALMLYLQQDFSEIIPKIIRAKNGLFINSVSLNGQDYLMRMISFCKGSSLAQVNNPSLELINSFASYLAKIDKSLNNFSHPIQNRYIAWDAKHAFENINSNKQYLSKKEEELVNFYLQNQLAGLKDSFVNLRQSVIHNDANDYNVLVNEAATKITALIDFGDSAKSYLINDLAIACSYLMISNKKPFEIAAEFVASYHKIYPLENIEIANLYSFIILRLCLSVTMSAKAKHDDPKNNYVSISENIAWQFLKKYRDLNKDIASNYLKEKLND